MHVHVYIPLDGLNLLQNRVRHVKEDQKGEEVVGYGWCICFGDSQGVLWFDV